MLTNWLRLKQAYFCMLYMLLEQKGSLPKAKYCYY